MRVGWLADSHDPPGGAELTQAEFRAAAPDGVEVADCPPGEVAEGLDRYVVHNCVGYTEADLWSIGDAPVTKYVHDLWPHGDEAVRRELLKRARLVFCSPLHRRYFDRTWGLAEGAETLIPPLVDLNRFRDAAESAQERSGAVSVAAWGNPGKSPHRAAEWAAGNGGIDFYGTGPYAPDGTPAVAYDDMPTLLASYETFVFLPDALEPFGRLVVEAHAAGCRVVTNRNVGARYWLEEAPEKLESAAEDFWKLVTGG